MSKDKQTDKPGPTTTDGGHSVKPAEGPRNVGSAMDNLMQALVTYDDTLPEGSNPATSIEAAEELASQTEYHLPE